MSEAQSTDGEIVHITLGLEEDKYDAIAEYAEDRGQDLETEMINLLYAGFYEFGTGDDRFRPS